MGNLSVYIPEESPVVAAIYAYHKQKGDSEPQRGYLGASIIGHSCERYLWYCFRQCCRDNTPGRIYRLFETGDLEEPRFIKELKGIGCEVHDIDENGNQFAIDMFGGHFSGHMDGCALCVPSAEKTWHVLEFKTHNNKSFTKLKKEGVKKSNPRHYAQMQMYMAGTGMKRTLYLAKNKDTDELYAERVRYDKKAIELLKERAERIITSSEPLARISEREDWWECRFCDAKEICHGSSTSALPVLSISCRQCCHATPKMDGQARWFCEYHKRGLSESDQDQSCTDHLVLPGLIGFARPIDHRVYPDGKEYNEYECEDGTTWRNGQATGDFTTLELQELSISTLKNRMVSTAKELFDATVVNHSSDDILSRYPREDSEVVWYGKINELAGAWKKAFSEDLISLTPIAKNDDLLFRAAEFEGERVAVIWPNTKEAEILKGKK